MVLHIASLWQLPLALSRLLQMLWVLIVTLHTRVSPHLPMMSGILLTAMVVRILLLLLRELHLLLLLRRVLLEAWLLLLLLTLGIQIRSMVIHPIFRTIIDRDCSKASLIDCHSVSLSGLPLLEVLR
jgi:hypothetical protein